MIHKVSVDLSKIKNIILEFDNKICAILPDVSVSLLNEMASHDPTLCGCYGKTSAIGKKFKNNVY